MRLDSMRSIVASVAAAAGGSLAHASLVNTAWVGPAVGQWEVASNWSANAVPHNVGATTFAVTVAGPAAQSPLVLLASSVQIATLAMQAGNTVQVMSFGTLGISGGSIVDNGTLSLAGAEGLATLRLDADTTLTGTGALVGGEDGSNRVLGANGTVRLTNAAGHAIQGSLLLGANVLRLTNEGSIDANAGFGITMDLSESGSNFNSGTLRTSAPTVLRVQNTLLDNTGGLIEAAGGGQVQLLSSTIKGGTLRDADGDGPSSLTVSGSTVLESLNLEAALAVPESQTLRIRGTIWAPQGLQMQGGALQANLLIDAAEATLAGDCVLSTLSSLQNRIYGSSPANRLVLASGTRFAGCGQFGVQSLALTNHGTIEADGFHDLVIALAGGVGSANDGVIRCGADRTLRMVQSGLDNSGGLIATESTGILTLDESNIVGGTLRASPGGIFTMHSSSVSGTRLEGDGTPGSGVFMVEGGSSQSPYPLFQGATFAPGVALEGSVVAMSGTVHFEGPMNLALSGSPYVRVPNAGLTLAGPGPTTIGSDGSGSFRFLADGTQLVIGAEHSVVMSSNGSRFGGGASQYGTVTAGVTNRGAIQPRLGLALGSNGVFVNEGSVDIATTSFISLDGLYGHLPIRFIQRDGTLTLNGQFTSRYWVPPQPSANFVIGLSELTVEGGRLQGAGAITGALVATGGIVAPGNGSVGVLTVQAGDEAAPGAPVYEQGNAATLQVAFGEPLVSAGTSLSVGGPVSLGGTLEVLLPGSMDPPAGAVHVALLCDGPISGTFSTVACRLPVEVEYQAGAVVVRVLEGQRVVGDLNGDGVVSGADLGALLAAWGACGEGACDADLDGNGTVGGADLGILLSHWG